ncbi:nuclease domain-containing protein [Burkholderia gladioli]|uniref:nuclease domain-containing protein n=1 Tax=Burkholderia gladioli TaxID=28095 RepID=UPI00163F88B4|nr:nuclease domain-containing protein [Burkholderia gladioli]
MSKITLSARGEACALRFPGVCNLDWSTTVWAHGNDIAGGKAKGKKLKRADHIGCYACYACHMVLDGQARRPDHLSLDFIRSRELRARQECEVILRAKNLWPSDEELAQKPVSAYRPPVKRVTPAAERVIVKKITTHTPIQKREKPAEDAERARSRWGQGRKLQSANRLQSRSFGSR